MSTWLRRIEPAIFYSVLLYAALLLFSVNYQTILPGLDPSWGYAMNVFAHSPQIFGKDIVFTYGPLAYLAVPQHVGSNIPIAAAVHVAVWAILIYLLVTLRESGMRFGALVFTVALICSNRLYFDYWDYLLSAILLLIYLLLFRKPESVFLFLLLSLTTGALLLIKFTGYGMAMLLLTAYSLERLLRKPRATPREILLLALAFSSGPLAYLLYNPSLTGLIVYIRGSLSVSSGYATTMSYPTESGAAWHAGLLSLIVLSSGAFCLWKRWVSPAGAAMVLITLWVAFKHGFVRSEPVHQAMFYCFAILAFAFLLAQMNYSIRQAALFTVLFSAVTRERAPGRKPPVACVDPLLVVP